MARDILECARQTRAVIMIQGWPELGLDHNIRTLLGCSLMKEIKSLKNAHYKKLCVDFKYLPKNKPIL